MTTATPGATYRLQFRKEFTFRDALAIVPYLAELGIADAYASPILKARPGSSHGYGITLMPRLAELETQLGESDPALHEFESIITAVKHLPRRSETDPALVAERQREKEIIKRRLGSLTAENPAILEFIAQSVTQFN